VKPIFDTSNFPSQFFIISNITLYLGIPIKFIGPRRYNTKKDIVNLFNTKSIIDAFDFLKCGRTQFS
jgi:hypothetical protein